MEPSITMQPTPELFEAISLVQGSIETMKRTGVNNGYTFSYIYEIMDYLRPRLKEHGLSMIQSPVGKNKLITTVTHKSGGYMSWTFDLPSYYDPIMTVSQSWSAAITKARKTACKTIFNITDKDDLLEKDGADTGGTQDIESELSEWVANQISNAQKTKRWSKLQSYFSEQLGNDENALQYALKELNTAAFAAGVQLP